MSKEAIAAIFAGLLIGSIVGFGVWRANSYLDTTKNTASQSQDKENGKNNSAPVQKNGISLLSPEEYDVIGENYSEIKGLTKPNSTVVVSGELEDKIIKTENGEFSVKISLEEGLNWILIKSISDDIIYQKEIKIVYSTKFAQSNE